ncbi:MAG: ATP-binding protein [Myxococcales bacterium]|nr:ATP-binding protein [Myxococcales bacterium]
MHWSKDELEHHLRELIALGVEGPKLDFKRELNLDTARQKVELAKDVSAIANTDVDRDADHGYGFVVLGVDAGKLCGASGALSAGKIDNTSAQVTKILREYLEPVPAATLHGFVDPDVGPWAAIVIEASFGPPHVFIKEYSGRPARGDWYVRVNDITEPARPTDFARVIARVTERAVRPLEIQVQSLELRLGMAERRLAERHHGPNDETPPSAPPTMRAASISELLRQPEDEIEERLSAEALAVVKLISDPEALPWSLNGVPKERVEAMIVGLEDTAQSFATAAMEVVRYDRSEAYADVVVRAVDILAEEQRPSVPHQEGPQSARLYPLVLALHGLLALAAHTGRFKAINAVFDLPLRPEFDHYPDGVLLDAYRYLWSASPLFRTIVGERNVIPVPTRIREILPGWLAPVVPTGRPVDMFFVGEFLLCLRAIAGTGGQLGQPWPSAFTYESQAAPPIKKFLKRRPQWLQRFLGAQPEDVLKAFDDSARGVGHRTGGMPRGLCDGTLEAFRQTNDD